MKMLVSLSFPLGVWEGGGYKRLVHNGERSGSVVGCLT